jgi:hypothetical protein
MAYTTISQLPAKSVATMVDSDELLISSGDRSYKCDVDTLKNFMASIFNLEDIVFENKDITSISNTIHATSTHKRTLCGVAGLKRGDLVTLQPHDHELQDGLGLPDLPAVQKADNRFAPAIGIVKEIYDGADWVLESDTFEKEIGEQWDTAVVIMSGLFTPFNTSMYQDGQILWLGEDGEMTTVKPVSLTPQDADRMQQPVGFVLFSCPAHLTEQGLHEGALQVLFANPEQHAHDIALHGWDFNLQETDVETAVAEVFSLCSQEIVNTDRILIENDEALLSRAVDGESIFGSARIFDDETSMAYDEYTCQSGQLYDRFVFDSVDSLNGKYAEFSYISPKLRNWTLPWE